MWVWVYLGFFLSTFSSALRPLPQDNPQLPRVFSTGVFFFILMYTGSNILPIAEFLKYSHMKQSFRPDEVRTMAGQLEVSWRSAGGCVPL